MTFYEGAYRGSVYLVVLYTVVNVLGVVPREQVLTVDSSLGLDNVDPTHLACLILRQIQGAGPWSVRLQG